MGTRPKLRDIAQKSRLCIDDCDGAMSKWCKYGDELTALETSKSTLKVTKLVCMKGESICKGVTNHCQEF